MSESSIKTNWSIYENGKKAEEHILNKNPYDMNCWMVLLREAQTRPIAESRILYEKALAQFPSCFRFLKQYIDKEMKEGDLQNVEEIYSRFLPKILSVELYQSYISFLIQTKNGSPDFKETIIRAYEVSLEAVGMDYLSFPIWNEYLQFLKSSEVLGTFAENQKVTMLRKLYMKYISVPMNNLDIIWKDYCAFEQGCNKAAFEKVLSERLRDFNHVKRVSKDLESMLKGIIKVIVPIPSQGTSSELLQIDLWNKYVQWEKSNPLGYDDPYAVSQRVIFAYDQFLANYYFHPKIWIEAIQYVERLCRKVNFEGDRLRSASLIDYCRSLYKSAVSGHFSDNLLLNFSYADFEESYHNHDTCTEIYEKLLKFPNTDHSKVYIHYMKYLNRTKGIEACRAIFKRARQQEDISYQVYVCAAKREYYSTSDINTSLKIFELGLKRFPSIPEYFILFMNHLKKLRDQINVRSVYERLLTIFDQSIAKNVLSEYHHFETEQGSLSSILDIEDRIISKFNNEDNLNIKLLISRYFIFDETSHICIDNFPHHKDISKSSVIKNSLIDSNTMTSDLSIPDFTQMRPFKPAPLPSFNTRMPHIIPGGTFPPPPLVADMLCQLPPPNCFKGPFVDVESLINIFLKDFPANNQSAMENSEHIENPNLITNKNDPVQVMRNLYFARQSVNISN